LPRLPEDAHVWHRPEQGVSQQTPSTQLPDLQIAPVLHELPFASGWPQMAPLHTTPVAQSVLVVQLDVHAVAPQMKGAHVVFVMAGQCPPPSQFAAAVATPAEQLAERHDCVDGGNVHVARVVPSQVPAHVEPSPVQSDLPPTGAPVTGEQVPFDADRLHASHCPVHAESQQTPSTQ
jgi:hypothetical protein